MSETERCPSQEGFQQGDLLQIAGRVGFSTNHCMGVVINADCDLAHEKHDGVIAYLPVYSLQQYLELFWMPKFFQEERMSAWKNVCELCGSEPSRWKELEDWLVAESIETIATSISNSENLTTKQSRNLESYLSCLRVCASTKAGGVVGFRELCALQRDPQAYARKRINAAFQQMGEGHFLINEIEGQKDIGFVVRMRRIHSIDALDCFRSVAEFKSSSGDQEICAYRIARLRPPFRYRVAQLFAHQFSRIGLPDEVKALNELAFDDVIETISGDRP